MNKCVLFAIVIAFGSVALFKSVPSKRDALETKQIVGKDQLSRPKQIDLDSSSKTTAKLETTTPSLMESSQFFVVLPSNRDYHFSHKNFEFDRSRELHEEGATAKFFNYIIVRTPSIFRSDNPDVIALNHDWKRDSEAFITDELGIQPSPGNKIEDLDRAAFGAYVQKTEYLIEHAQKIFGADIAIVLEGELKDEFEKSYDRYEQSLKTLLGDGSYRRFDTYRKVYRQATVSRLGWLPGSIIK